MPAKLVYGKRKTAQQAPPSFSNFISPVKLDHAVSVPKSKADSGPEMDRSGHPSKMIEEIDTLNDMLLDLNFGKKYEETRRKSLGGKEKIWREAQETGKVEVEGKKEKREIEEKTEKDRRSRPRKALVDRNGNSELPTKDHDEVKPTKHKKKRNQNSAADVLEPPKIVGTSEPATKSQCAPKTSPPYVLTSKSTPDLEPELPDIYTAYTNPLLSASLTRKVIPFSRWSADLEPHFSITKIAEASFSEVYRLSVLTHSLQHQDSVLKLIPLKVPSCFPLPSELTPIASTTRTRPRNPAAQLSRERTKRLQDNAWKSAPCTVSSETRLLQSLNHIPGFTNFRDLTLLQGPPPPFFAAAWKAWNAARPKGRKSEFPDPGKKGAYEDAQIWAVIEMQDAGTDVESLVEGLEGELGNVWAVWDVFWGVCMGIAKAEESCGFEHRDLHLGNICVRPSASAAEGLTLADVLRRKFNFTALETTVIDYTLSRATVSDVSCPRAMAGISLDWMPHVKAKTNVAFFDLDEDPAIFEGDAEVEYQYEIYRMMRGVVVNGNPGRFTPPAPVVDVGENVKGIDVGKQKEEEDAPRRSPRKHAAKKMQNTHIRFSSPPPSPRLRHQEPQTTTQASPWQSFNPLTNLLWAQFLLYKLLAHLEDSESPFAHPHFSAEFVSELEEAKLEKKAKRLLAVLNKVQRLLDPGKLGKKGGLESVRELVVRGIESGWVRAGDVSG